MGLSLYPQQTYCSNHAKAGETISYFEYSLRKRLKNRDINQTAFPEKFSALGRLQELQKGNHRFFLRNVTLTTRNERNSDLQRAVPGVVSFTSIESFPTACKIGKKIASGAGAFSDRLESASLMCPAPIPPFPRVASRGIQRPSR